MHHLELHGPDEIDEEVLAWLREATERAGERNPIAGCGTHDAQPNPNPSEHVRDYFATTGALRTLSATS